MNKENLVKCSCGALFDKTLKWAWGYHEGTSDNFNTVLILKKNTCPICGKDHK